MMACDVLNSLSCTAVYCALLMTVACLFVVMASAFLTSSSNVMALRTAEMELMKSDVSNPSLTSTHDLSSIMVKISY